MEDWCGTWCELGSNFWAFSFWFNCSLAVWSCIDQLGSPSLVVFAVKGRIFAAVKFWSWLNGCAFAPLPDCIKIKLLIPDLERRLRRMYSSLNVVSVAFEKCNPVCLILFLKGHSTYCPNIIIKIFHLGIGQQFIKPSLCPCSYAPALWKTQQQYLTQWPQAK